MQHDHKIITVLNCKFFLLSVVFLVLVSVQTSHSLIMTFTDRSTFYGQLSNYTIIDFNDVWERPFQPPFSDGNVTVTALGGLYSTFWSGSNSNAVGAENSGTINISFAGGTQAVGFYIGYHYNRPEALMQYTFTGLSGIIETNTGRLDPKLSLDKVGSFYGFISDAEEILNLELYAYVPFVPVWPIIDNVTSGSLIPDVAPVPEPATIILLGTGLLGLVGASRKKLKKLI